MNIRSRKGFTLVEILVVVSIIGILTGVIIGGVASARVKARDARRVADIKQISKAIENYFSSCYSYPSALTNLTTSGCTAYIPVITSLPQDPQASTNVYYRYYTDTLGGLGGTSGSGRRYHVCATLETSAANKGKAGIKFNSIDVCDGTADKTFDVVGGVY